MQGVGIDRVWVPPLASLGEQQREFASILGINAAAMSDSETSNAAFVERLGIPPDNPLAQQIMSCRFEFVETIQIRKRIIT